MVRVSGAKGGQGLAKQRPVLSARTGHVAWRGVGRVSRRDPRIYAVSNLGTADAVANNEAEETSEGDGE